MQIDARFDSKWALGDHTSGPVDDVPPGLVENTFYLGRYAWD